jgi:hypothetical protein
MRKVTTRITWDIDGNIVEHEWFWYDGPVALCKGDSTAQAAEQQQAAFDTQLMQMFTAQYGNQQNMMNFLKGTLMPQIANPTGYDKATLAAMRTGATDTLSTEYNNAKAALQNSENQKNGGSDLPSGVNSQLDSALLSQEAQAKAGAQENITVQDASLKNANYWNAVNALSGQEAQMNPLGYAGAATSGSGAVSNLSNAVTASAGPTIGSILGGVVGAGVGAVGQVFQGKG